MGSGASYTSPSARGGCDGGRSVEVRKRGGAGGLSVEVWKRFFFTWVIFYCVFLWKFRLFSVDFFRYFPTPHCSPSPAQLRKVHGNYFFRALHPRWMLWQNSARTRMGGGRGWRRSPLNLDVFSGTDLLSWKLVEFAFYQVFSNSARLPESAPPAQTSRKQFLSLLVSFFPVFTWFWSALICFISGFLQLRASPRVCSAGANFSETIFIAFGQFFPRFHTILKCPNLLFFKFSPTKNQRYSVAAFKKLQKKMQNQIVSRKIIPVSISWAWWPWRGPLGWSP